MAFTMNPFIHVDRENKRGTIIEVHISDLHFGVMDPKVQFDILSEQFLSKIAEMPFDILSIDGDLFDHKFLSNSDAVMYAVKFVDVCVWLCKNKGATLVLLHGTESHDAKQLKLFYHYIEDPYLDIRIVETARFEIIKGAKVLCLPEEYNKGADYYNRLLHQSLYDTVFMHGTIKGAIYGADHEDLDNVKNPVFDINSFSHCMGPIIAGHVHVAGCFDKYMYYNGSPYRWCFGEEAPKGFLIVCHNLDTQEHYAHFEEIKSFRYDTINIDDLAQGDPREVINYVKQLQSQGIDNIRLEMSTADADVINILNSYYRSNPHVKIKANTPSIRERQAKEMQEFEEKYGQFGYILDKDLSPYEILSRYINQNKGYIFITTEELISILNEVD